MRCPPLRAKCPPMNRDTRIQHEGEDREFFLGSVSPPVFRSSLFAFPDSASLEKAFKGGRDRYLYSRVSNPTVRVLEEKVALLEKAEDAIAFGSGMGAISAVLLAFLGSGDHLICFSRAMAEHTSLVASKYTSMPTLYLLVNPSVVFR